MTIKQKLQAPFDESEIEWRIGRSGKNSKGIYAMCLAYVSNRAIMNRLDDVFGVMGWKNNFKEWHTSSQLCEISVYNEELKEWVTKVDGADATNIEATKGGLSDSMKRCAVQFGIGRYLYNLEEGWATIYDKKGSGRKYAKLSKSDGETPFYWSPPSLPNWALPKTEPKPRKNYTEMFAKCDSIIDLKLLWGDLDATEQREALSVKNNRKKELVTEGNPFE